MISTQEIIRVEHLTKVYRKGIIGSDATTALHDVSFSIYEGEILAVLGTNGAGKTTLTKCILQLIRPTAGTIVHSEKLFSSSKQLSHIGYLPELFRVPPYMTAQALLRSLGSLSGLKGKVLDERIRYVLGLVQLEEQATLTTKNYSKGMIVRLGIAQAILDTPLILFLDEPTDALDPLGKVMVRNLLLELSRQGTTIIINSHLLSEIELIAHRAAIFHKGKLLRIGTVPELIGEYTGYYVVLPCYVEFPSGIPCNHDATGWKCEINSTSQLQECLQFLKTKNITPVNIIPKRTTLEEIFIKTIVEQ